MYKLKVLYLFIFLGTIGFLLVGAMSSIKDDKPVSNEGRIKFSHSLHNDLVDCQDLPFISNGKRKFKRSVIPKS